MAAKPPTGNKVSQTELYQAVSQSTGESVATVTRVLDEVQVQIMKALHTGDGVSLRIGIFKRADRKARAGRNPQTGESLRIAAKKGTKFQPSPKLLDHLN